MAHRAVEIKVSLRKLTSQLENGAEYNKGLLDSINHNIDILLEELNEERETPECWQTAAEVLFEDLCESKTLIGVALKEIDLLKKENAEIKVTLNNHEKKIEQIEGKLKYLEANRLLLMLGQISYDIDGKVTKKVLDGIVPEEEHISTISDMEAAVNGTDHFDVFKSESEKEAAKSKWESLKKEMRWSEKLFRYLKKLKSNRVPIAHPPVDRQFIETALKSQKMELPSPNIIDKPLLTQLLEIHTTLADD